MQDVLILAAPGQVAAGTSAPISTTNYILRVSSKNAARFVRAADNGTIWFALRPQTRHLSGQ
jgi:hypothetical protein